MILDLSLGEISREFGEILGKYRMLNGRSVGSKGLNNCIITSSIPSEWKTARITQLYKDRNRDDPNNYRPISVLPFI